MNKIIHIEMMPDMVREWTSSFTDDIANGGECGQSAEQMLDNLERRVADLNRAAELMLGYWIDQFAPRV